MWSGPLFCPPSPLTWCFVACMQRCDSQRSNWRIDINLDANPHADSNPTSPLVFVSLSSLQETCARARGLRSLVRSRRVSGRLLLVCCHPDRRVAQQLIEGHGGSLLHVIPDMGVDVERHAHNYVAEHLGDDLRVIAL